MYCRTEASPDSTNDTDDAEAILGILQMKRADANAAKFAPNTNSTSLVLTLTDGPPSGNVPHQHPDAASDVSDADDAECAAASRNTTAAAAAAAAADDDDESLDGKEESISNGAEEDAANSNIHSSAQLLTANRGRTRIQVWLSRSVHREDDPNHRHGATTSSSMMMAHNNNHAAAAASCSQDDDNGSMEEDGQEEEQGGGMFLTQEEEGDDWTTSSSSGADHGRSSAVAAKRDLDDCSSLSLTATKWARRRNP